VLERVVNFRVDHEELIGRLLQRAIEQGRRDDTEAVIRRQEVYVEETAPLLASYADRGILITIDGSGGVEDVAQRALDALAASAETSPESDVHATTTARMVVTVHRPSRAATRSPASTVIRAAISMNRTSCDRRSSAGDT
jgi:hypothetical protein